MIPPDKRLIYLVLLAVAVLVAWWLSGIVFADTPVREPFVSLEVAFVRAPNIPYIPTTYVLGTIVDETLYEIVRCESGFNPVAKNPKSTAYGLCQFLDSTWKYVQNKWEMDLNRHSPEDQLYACERLLREEGDIHWAESKECWNK